MNEDTMQTRMESPVSELRKRLTGQQRGAQLHVQATPRTKPTSLRQGQSITAQVSVRLLATTDPGPHETPRLLLTQAAPSRSSQRWC